MINIFKIFGTSSGRGVSSGSGTSQELDPSWQDRSVMDNSTVLAASGMAQDFVEPSGDAMVSGGSVTSSLCGGSRFGFRTLFYKRVEAEVFALFFGEILGWMKLKILPAFKIQTWLC